MSRRSDFNSGGVETTPELLRELRRVRAVPVNANRIRSDRNILPLDIGDQPLTDHAHHPPNGFVDVAHEGVRPRAGDESAVV